MSLTVMPTDATTRSDSADARDAHANKVRKTAIIRSECILNLSAKWVIPYKLGD
jgi:hypothetical protein